MFQTRTQLVRRLQGLETALERRIEANPDTADPWPDVEAEADRIRRSASAADRDYVAQRISCILARQGLIPSDDADRVAPCLPRATPASPPAGARP